MTPNLRLKVRSVDNHVEVLPHVRSQDRQAAAGLHTMRKKGDFDVRVAIRGPWLCDSGLVTTWTSWNQGGSSRLSWWSLCCRSASVCLAAGALRDVVRTLTITWSLFWRAAVADARFQLAQINIARMRAPLADPIMADFVANLPPINALADTSPGFVWRLQTEEGDATAVRPVLGRSHHHQLVRVGRPDFVARFRLPERTQQRHEATTRVVRLHDGRIRRALVGATRSSSHDRRSGRANGTSEATRSVARCVHVSGVLSTAGRTGSRVNIPTVRGRSGVNGRAA